DEAHRFHKSGEARAGDGTQAGADGTARHRPTNGIHRHVVRHRDPHGAFRQLEQRSYRTGANAGESIEEEKRPGGGASNQTEREQSDVTLQPLLLVEEAALAEHQPSRALHAS
ncbi:MAG: hypothetical protein SGPRY_001856, partial [Prymnesium sp.]